MFSQPSVSLSDDNNQLLQEFDVTLDISEDDGKGSYTPVSMDKDCFKLRQNMLKKVAVAISQPNTERPLLIERLGCGFCDCLEKCWQLYVYCYIILLCKIMLIYILIILQVFRTFALAWKER